MPYNLPPPWDPGYALPTNAKDEGLQRHAFTTKEAPRGTYDQPNVGYGGYAVPQYIKDEGYGQGVFVSTWQPNGTYNGRKIPHFLNQRPQVTSDQKLPGGGRKVVITRNAPTPPGSPATDATTLAGLTDPATYLPLAAVGLAAYFLLRKKR